MNGLGKILVVDDSSQIRLLVNAFLTEQGYNVVSAASGEQTLAMLQADAEIDLVLLDVIMPGMDGFETLKAIRSQPQTELVKVIMLTSSGEMDDMARAFEMGAQDYVTKPYRPLELKARVETHLRLKQREEKLKEQEATLRQSEERFRMVSQLATDFAYMVEFDGEKSRLLWIFGDFERISGRPFSAYLYPQVLDYIHPDDRTTYDAYFKKATLQGQKSEVEYRVKHTDGSYRWLHNELHSIEKDAFSQSGYFIGVIKDITSQRMAEAELAANNRFLKKLFITAPMRISVYNQTTNQVEYSNQSSAAYLPGIPIKDYNALPAQEKFTRFAHPDDHDVWDDLLAKSNQASDDVPNTIEFRRMGADSCYHWHRTYMTAFERNAENQSVSKYLTINVDITEEKEAKLALQKAHDELETRVRKRTIELEKTNSELSREIEQRRLTNAHLKATLNNNLQAFILLDAHQKVLTYNRVFENMVERILHKTVDEDKTAAHFIPERGLAIFESYFNKAMGGQVHEFEFNLMSEGGTLRWYRACFTPSLTDDNEVMGVCIALLDVSQQKKAELELEKERLVLKQRVIDSTLQLQDANAELLRANHAKDEFLAAMSHELRTPLNAVLSSTGALQDGIYGSLSDPQQRVLKGVMESGQDLLVLINDILDVARAEVGKIRLEINLVRVDTVVNAAIRLVQDQARQKEIQIEVKLDEQVIYLKADEMRLKQMLTNLLLNAIKFTPAEGRVGIEVNGHAKPGSVRLTVWDTGAGVPQEFIPRMFKPFEQAAPQGKTYTGSGLGLYLVQKMADMHGGGVQVESEPGQGSRFTISLPWKDKEQPVHGQQKKKGSGRLVLPFFDTHPLILVAEDNEIALSVMVDALKARGCQVLEARNGKEVIDQMEGQMINLILMDIQMPEMDGVETIRFLRDKGFSHTPIIAITAATLPGNREICLEAGANDYFSKPVDLDRLVLTMKELLG